MNTTAFGIALLFKSVQQWILTLFNPKFDSSLIHTEEHCSLRTTTKHPVINIDTISSSKTEASRHKPVRVVQVFDLQHTHTGIGRIVISGRMADVCAELDRLAALEAA